MVQMLLAEGMLLCSLFWAFCWLGTGSDEKNIRNFSTYPDEVQKIVKASPELSGNIRQRGLRPSSLEICFCLLRSCLRWGFSPGRNILQATF